jgi:hypothetical protein
LLFWNQQQIKMARDKSIIFAQMSFQEFNASYCQVWDLGGVAEQKYKDSQS